MALNKEHILTETKHEFRGELSRLEQGMIQAGVDPADAKKDELINELIDIALEFVQRLPWIARLFLNNRKVGKWVSAAVGVFGDYLVKILNEQKR